MIARASVVQHKTREPVRFELTDQTREAVQAWIKRLVLPSPRPLRTRRASFPAPGSSLGRAPRSTRRADEARLHELELPAAGGAVNLRRLV